MKHLMPPLFALALLPFAALLPAAAQNAAPAPANPAVAAPAGADTSVPGSVAPPATPKTQSGIGQGMKNAATHMGTLGATDAEFVRKAVQGGMGEMTAGKTAEKAGDQAVKQFGRKMVEDHGKLNQQLATVAQTKGMTMPTQMEADAKSMMQKMGGMSGSTFDRAYMKAMVADHEKDIALFQKEADSGQDADIKQVAQEALPMLKEHLSMAQSIEGKMASK